MKFETEASLCLAFAQTLPSAWTAYNETADFDMVLVHHAGSQIAVEAKKTLNAKVLAQVIETRPHWNFNWPDFRAVLVGGDPNKDLLDLAAALGVTVLTVGKHDRRTSSYGRNTTEASKFYSRPEFPKPEKFGADKWTSFESWFDHVPAQRLVLPEYVPDVPAGVPSPTVMGAWKIRAMKVCIWLEMHETITRAHFQKLGIDPGRWMNGHWLKKGPSRGVWVAGPHLPAQRFKAEHSVVWQQIVDDYPKWSVDTGIAAL